MDEETLFQIIAVLLHKMGNPTITLTEQDLNEALEAHNADRLIFYGIGGEMHVGIYNKDNEPIRPDVTHAFH